MKTIVTHIGPDLDALTSVWLVKTFFPGWEEASIAFVPAGTTLNKQPPDANPDIMHVDTGFGRFDHHQTDADICAATLVYDEIATQTGPNEALRRIVQQVNEVDHFKTVFYPEPEHDRWDFDLASIIDGLRLMHAEDQQRIVGVVFPCFDALYKTFQNKVWADQEITKHSTEFTTRWGKSLGLNTPNDDVIHLAQKRGFRVVVRKDPRKNYVRIKSLPLPDIDLTAAYEALKAKDPEASWFLHASKHMVLNGSAKNPDMRPTSLSLADIIAVLQEL